MKLQISEQIGYDLAKGFTSYISRLFIIGIILSTLYYLICSKTGWGRDSTDADSWHPSGLKPLTDHATGVQYLSDGKGGLITRLNPDGSLYK